MASVYDLKPKFQSLLRPIVNGLAKLHVTPNQVTIFATVLSIGVGTCIALYPTTKEVLLLVPLILFIRMALNAIDGMLAREYNMQTSLGAILNELGDVISDTALYLPLALIPGLNPVVVIALIILALLSEMTGVISVQIGASRRYDGPMGKSDRAFWLGLIVIGISTGMVPLHWINIGLVIITVLIVATIGNRIVKSLGELK
ncbi:MAG: CDP-alcohol phosphatidyltransferase family protein [Fibrobacterales bacterium]